MTRDFAATFALVSYNQQDIVEEAARAVLAQDSDPLQIILSDDASSDRTFEILQKIAEEYQGPHHVTARRNAQNLGLNGHMKEVVTVAQCDFIIWIAGDDVSVPNRARRILEAQKKTGAKLIFSDAQTRRPDGSVGSQNYRKALLYKESFTLEEAATSFALYLGATAAWHKDLHDRYGGFPKDRAHEDLILGFRAAMENSLHYIPEDLVIYLEDAGVSSRLTRKTSGLENRARRRSILQGQLTVIEQRQKDVDCFGLRADHPARDAMRRLSDKLAMRLCYYDGGVRAYAGRPFRLSHALLSEWLRDIRNR